MGMSILFRNSGKKSSFRDALLELASIPGDEFILATGYIDPKVLSDNALLKSVEQGFCSVGKVIIVSGAFYNHNITDPNCNNHSPISGSLRTCCWCRHYKAADMFINYFNNKPNITIKQYNIPQLYHHPWHAKIALKLNRGKIVAAIIGSSNITSPAFGVNLKFYNNECDIYIWNRRYLNIHGQLSNFDDLYFDDIAELGTFISVLPVKLHKGISEKRIFDMLYKIVEPLRN